MSLLTVLFLIMLVMLAAKANEPDKTCKVCGKLQAGHDWHHPHAEELCQCNWDEPYCDID